MRNMFHSWVTSLMIGLCFCSIAAQSGHAQGDGLSIERLEALARSQGLAPGEYLPSVVCSDPLEGSMWQLLLGVVDATGALVPGVPVYFTSGEFERAERTNESGVLNLHGVVEGDWEIEVALPGFFRAVTTLSLRPGCQTSLLVPLQVIPGDGFNPYTVSAAERIAGKADTQCLVEVVESAESVQSASVHSPQGRFDSRVAVATIVRPAELENGYWPEVWISEYFSELEFRVSWFGDDDASEFVQFIRPVLQDLLARSIASCVGA